MTTQSTSIEHLVSEKLTDVQTRLGSLNEAVKRQGEELTSDHIKRTRTLKRRRDSLNVSFNSVEPNRYGEETSLHKPLNQHYTLTFRQGALNPPI
jgi:hypothetical protein